MTEKREWWSDDLINAVIDLQYHCLDCIEYDYSDIDPRNHDAVNAAWAYDVIAAVEDWHKAKRASRDRTHSDECWRWHQECAEQLIEQQQAAIDRVVRLAANWQRRFDSSIRHPADIASIPIKEVFSALDGAE